MKPEAALVTAGSFSALILGAAAGLTGTDPSRVDALPHPTWARRECLTQKAHRFDYDRAYRAAGMTMVDVETKEQLINAICERTAMLAVLASVERNPKPGVLMPEELVKIGKKVPVLIDAASVVGALSFPFIPRIRIPESEIRPLARSGTSRN